MVIKQRILQALCVLSFLINLPTVAHATTVTFDVTNISGNTWEYTYSITNDTLGVDIEEFTIFFDVGLYDNLSATSTPSTWDPLVIQPDTNIPDDGFYDVLALVSGISAGSSLDSFSVQFDFLGLGAPGAQYYEIVDPFTFNALDSGFTSAVPVPAAAWLFLSGLLSFVSLNKFRLQKNINKLL